MHAATCFSRGRNCYRTCPNYNYSKSKSLRKICKYWGTEGTMYGENMDYSWHIMPLIQ